MFSGPMTVLVMAALGLCLLIGLAVLFSALAVRQDRPRCEQCRHVNRRQAKFCARCGKSLTP
jgi:rRNA maturation endonuclease Nob1